MEREGAVSLGLGVVAEAAGGGTPEVLAERLDGVVVRSGSAVAKAHAPDTDTDALETRLRIAAHPLLAGILLPPLPVRSRIDGRHVTVWPFGEPVGRDDPDAAPWEPAAALLALLHAVPLRAFDSLPGPLPAMRGPAKVARAMARLRDRAGDTPAAAEVSRAHALLPARARGDAPQPLSGTLVHGDLHLGQLVRREGEWRLIDVDDLGLGDPAWDLARPAAWFATGLLAPDVWGRFLGAYRAAGGIAVPEAGDPWAVLDTPARALTVQLAALAVVKAAEERRPLDEVDLALVDACARIAVYRPHG